MPRTAICTLALLGALPGLGCGSPSSATERDAERPAEAGAASDAAVPEHHLGDGGGASSAAAWTELEFHVDYPAGTYDRAGRFLGGTEINDIVPYGGRLFATASYWNVDPDTPNPGPTILVKDGADAPWRVEAQLGPDHVRAEMMTVLTFTTDREGVALDPPVQMLAIGVTRRAEEASVWTRDDATGDWSPVLITMDVERLDGELKPGVRSMVTHLDPETGVHSVFAGTSAGQLFRGGYAPAAPGRLAFETEPELVGPARIHAMTTFETELYASLGVHASLPGGGLWRRAHGERPTWERVAEWALASPRDKPGLRAIRPVPHPSRPGVMALLGAREDPGVVELIEPHAGHRVSLEHDVRAFYEELWGELGGAATIVAYNEFTEVRHPDTGEISYLAGLYVNHPDRLTPPHNGSHFLERRLDGTYHHGTVWDPDHPVPEGTQLRGTRTIAVSPFSEDQGRVLYFGGFDAHARGTSHANTAWIYRAVLPRRAP